MWLFTVKVEGVTYTFPSFKEIHCNTITLYPKDKEEQEEHPLPFKEQYKIWKENYENWEKIRYKIIV